ncbi:MAG: prolyl oligopeptidase family serine peptidase [Duganella sp.]
MRRLLLLSLATLACATLSTAPARAAEPPPVEAFFGTPRIDHVQLSPDGAQVALALKLPDGTLGIGVRGTDAAGKVRLLTRVDGVNVGVYALHWVNNKRLGYTLKNLRRNAATGGDVFAIDLDGTNQRHLISGDWSTRNEAQTGSMIGNRTLTAEYLYVGNTYDGSDDIVVAKARWNNVDLMSESSRLHRLNTRTQRLSSAFDGAQPPAIKQWLLDHDAVPRVVTSVLKGRCIASYRKPDDTSWTEIDNSDCVQGRNFVPLFFDGSDTLYVNADYRGYAALYRYDLKALKLDGEPIVETVGFDFTGYPEIDKTSRRLVGLHLTTDARTTVWFNATLKAEQEKIDALLTGTVNTVTCPADCFASPVLLVRRENDRMPAEYALYTRATGALLGLGSSHPDIKPAQMGQRSFHRYAARDGREIPAYVTLPAAAGEPGNGPRPAIVLVHGGPMVRGGSWEWDDEAAFLATRGYVVIQPEFRGSAGFGSDHVNAGLRQWGGAMQDDLADAAQWAVRQGWADPGRIGIMGGSYGGYATLMGLIKDPQVFRAGVAWSGVTDLGLLFTSLQSDATEEALDYGMRATIGDPDRDAALFRTNSPLRRAAELKQPLLIGHGLDDRRVPLDHATNFYSAVKAHNRQVQLVTYDDEGHSWRKQETILDFWRRVEVFLDANLKQAK